ncbi:MAG TPA: tyrosine-type recombinase/integrase [Blastocatellia bacterium]|nr:tyrosine-type recombinase/integrase [Blastocatellia bacterium]
MREKPYTERDGKIYAVVNYTDSKGVRRQIWRKAESKTDARNLARDLKDQLRNGTEQFEHTLTLDQYLDKWFAHIKGKRAEKTIEGYELIIRLYIKPFLGRKQLSKIKPLDVQGMVDELEASFSPKTVREANNLLARALKQAIKWRLITTNPARDVELPIKVQKEMKCFTPEEAQKFLEEASKDKYGLMFELALLTGMRPSEYFALQWTDLDFQKNTVTIQRALYRHNHGGNWAFKEPKTLQSRRTIPLPRYLTQELADYKRHQAEERLKMGAKWQNYNVVFASSNGNPLSRRNIEKRHFKPILVKAELPDIRLYDLRHTCATLLLADGENIKVVSERLGHADAAMVLRVYGHVLKGMQQGATDRIEAIVRRK